MKERLTKLIKEANERYIYAEEQAQYLMDNDVVEVVRCKDCEFRYTKECPQFILPLDDNDFCSYGERKE